MLHPVRLSVCPSRASNFLEIRKRQKVETFNLVVYFRLTHANEQKISL